MATYDARPSGFTQLTTTSDWESFMSSAGIWDGIDGASSFAPSLDTVGRNAVISAGQCVIKGQLWRADAPVSTPIPAASSQNRIDILVLQLNRSATSSPTVIQPLVITGTPAASPVAPPITQNPTGIYQIPVSQWTSASSGALSGLLDQRQFAGRSVISMLSTNHPTPVNPRLGLETDTGRLFSYPAGGGGWMPVGSKLSDFSILGPGNVATAAPITIAWPVPASDGIPGVTVYELDIQGTAQSATGATANLTFGVTVNGTNTVLGTVGSSFFVANTGYYFELLIKLWVQASGANAFKVSAANKIVASNNSVSVASIGNVIQTIPWPIANANTLGAYAQWSAAAGTNQAVRAYGSQFSKY